MLSIKKIIIILIIIIIMYVAVGVGWNVGTCQKQSGAGEEHKRSSHLSSASNEDLDEEELVKLRGRLVTQIFVFWLEAKYLISTFRYKTASHVGIIAMPANIL